MDTNRNNQVTYEVVNKVFGKIANAAQENYQEFIENKNKYKKIKDNSEKDAKDLLAEMEKIRPYVLVIDEINRAPLASVLGELIYGLEYRGNAFSTPYTIKNGTNQLIVPPNLFIIGTMNTADRSIGSMDYAVRRRFAFLSLPSESKVIETSWENRPLKESIMTLYEAVRALFDPKNMADPSIDPEDIMLGHTYFLCDPDKCGTKDDAKAYMNYRLEYQIKPILKEYVKDGLLDGYKIADKITELTI